jgi:hypothetical protein
MTHKRGSLMVAFCLTLSACGSTDRQFVTDAQPISAGQSKQAGVGDTVLDLKITEPLPNAFGKADVFGRTRDAGRVIVRYLGERNGVAYFSRQNVTIQSNDTTMSRTGMYVPNVQQTTMTGNVGTIPVSATGTTVGSGTYIPPSPSQSLVLDDGRMALSAPIGGELLVEGRTITVLRATGALVVFSVR